MYEVFTAYVVITYILGFAFSLWLVLGAIEDKKKGLYTLKNNKVYYQFLLTILLVFVFSPISIPLIFAVMIHTRMIDND